MVSEWNDLTFDLDDTDATADGISRLNHLIRQSLGELQTLRAKLAEVERERDMWEARCTAIPELKGQLELTLEERDEARRWAGVWKRSAKMWRGEAHDWTSTTDSIGVGESVGDRYRRVK